MGTVAGGRAADDRLNFMHAMGLLTFPFRMPYVAPLAAVGAFFITEPPSCSPSAHQGTVAKSRIQSEQWPEELCRGAMAAYEGQHPAS